MNIIDSTKILPTRTVKVLVDNPKRGKCAERFGLYKGCKTVADVVAKYEKAGYTPRLAFADLRWDAERGFVQLGSSKTKTKETAH